MDSRHPTSNHPETTQPFREDYPFHATSTEQYGYHPQDNENSFNNLWGAGQYTPDGQESINGLNPVPQPWAHQSFQSSNYGAPNYSAMPTPYDQTFSRRPDAFDMTSSFPSHPQQSTPTTAFEPRQNGYNQVPPNANTQFNYPDQRMYHLPSNQSQTISPQALQHYPTPNSQAVPQKGRQPQSTPAVPGSGLLPPAASATIPRPPINSEGWKVIASKLPASIASRTLLVRDASEMSTTLSAKKHEGSSAFLSSSSVDVVAAKAHLPRYNKRRSKSEVHRLLLQEKGTGPWNLSRQPVRKKLKRTSVSTISPRPTASTSSGGTPTADSVSSTESSSESASEGDSEYSSGSDDELQIHEPSPLPKVRPADPEKATEYDITKAVWAKRSVALSGAVIRTALAECWEIFKGIRDKWKVDTANLQQAEEKKDKERVSQCRSRIEAKRRLLESCIRLTLKHGHNDIVERLGENPSMSALMIRWLKVDRETLEKTKLDKLLPKLVKKGDEKVKALAQKVLDNSGIASNKQVQDGKPAVQQSLKESTTANSIVDGVRPSEGGSSLKRPRASDPSGTLPNKKQAGSDSTVSASNKPIPKLVSGLEKRRQQAAKIDPKTASKAPSSAAVPEKVKTNHIAAKPSAFFSSLQSASKKPGTTKTTIPIGKGKDGRDATASDTKGAITAGSASKPAFSFAETMANLNKQKNDAPAKSEEARPPETPEEKRKRLRKEQRRKMRVSFKADDELVEVRTFVHDPEEELGHDDSMVRDVGDSRGEGQMLKMHKDLDLMDEEEEDYEPTEELPAVWHEPTIIDFTVIDPVQRQQSSVTRGGLIEVRSLECVLQEQRESSKLLVVYPSPADIPSSPREPSEQNPEAPTVEATFGQPGEETKAREAQYYASGIPQSSVPLDSVAGPPPTPDISMLLKIINGQQQPQQAHQQQPPPPPPTQAPPTGLEAIFAQFANNSNISQPTQAQMQAPTQAPIQPPAPSVYNFQAALAAMNPSNPSQSAYVPPPPTQQPNLQSILAQIGQQPAAQIQNYGYPNNYQTENDRKRQANFDDQSSGEHGYGKGKRQKGEEKKFFGPPRYPCRYWLEGKCTKGDACTFLHGEKPAG